MALPETFLPFDPNRDDEDEEEDEEEESFPESDEESNDHIQSDSMTNGETNHQEKATRHIGGGVILVSDIKLFLKKKLLK